MAYNHARAILKPRSNSHPFEDRCLEFIDSIKVGRAVARCKPLCDNAIFDCKVLSRNHALLWFDSGKRQFLVRDTRSSNGTFVNNQRLSPANEDSRPEELFSGDVVQFGVEVMESAKKMTHGCIVMCIKLYYPNGEEAIRPANHVSSRVIMPQTLLHESVTFMQHDLNVIADPSSMIPFMFSDNALPRVDMFLNSSNSSNQSINGTNLINSNNTGSSGSALDRGNLVNLINKNIRQPNKSTINNNGSNLTKLGNDGTATILKKPLDPTKNITMRESFGRLDKMSSDNYFNSTSSNYSYYDHTQGSNNVINQQQSFCPPTTSNSNQSINNGNPSVNMMGAVSSYYCETINCISLLKEAAQREQLLRQKLELVEQALEEAHLAADRGWKACIEEDLLLSKIETLQKKLEFLMRASKVAKSKQASDISQHEPQDSIAQPNLDSNNTKSIKYSGKSTSNNRETINDLEQQLKEKVLNYIDDKAKYELIAKDAIKKALQKEYLAFQRIHDLEALLKSSEEECQNLKESNEKLEQSNTSKDVEHQKQNEEITQERLILMKDIDELKRANSQLLDQYKNAIHESKKKIDEYEHRLEFASQQICDIQLKDKQLDNLRYQLGVVNLLYTHLDDDNQHLKQEVDNEKTQHEQLLERIDGLHKENDSLKTEIQAHRNRETILLNREKEINLCAIMPPLFILLTVLLAYLFGEP